MINAWNATHLTLAKKARENTRWDFFYYSLVRWLAAGAAMKRNKIYLIKCVLCIMYIWWKLLGREIISFVNKFLHFIFVAQFFFISIFHSRASQMWSRRNCTHIPSSSDSTFNLLVANEEILWILTQNERREGECEEEKEKSVQNSGWCASRPRAPSLLPMQSNSMEEITHCRENHRRVSGKFIWIIVYRERLVNISCQHSREGTFDGAACVRSSSNQPHNDILGYT